MSVADGILQAGQSVCCCCCCAYSYTVLLAVRCGAGSLCACGTLLVVSFAHKCVIRWVGGLSVALRPRKP